MYLNSPEPTPANLYMLHPRVRMCYESRLRMPSRMLVQMAAGALGHHKILPAAQAFRARGVWRYHGVAASLGAAGSLHATARAAARLHVPNARRWRSAGGFSAACAPHA